MAYSKVQIISLALIEIGKAPINDIEDAGDLGVAASLNYDLILDSILSNYSWRFATTQIQLSKLAASPLKNWQYAYSLPSNYLTAIDVIPHSRYEIFEKYIYSNLSELYLHYRFKPEEPQLPSYFVNYFKLEIALSLARFATVKESVIEELRAAAKEAKYAAVSTDSMARPNREIVDSRLTDARWTGSVLYSGSE